MLIGVQFNWFKFFTIFWCCGGFVYFLNYLIIDILIGFTIKYLRLLDSSIFILNILLLFLCTPPKILSALSFSQYNFKRKNYLIIRIFIVWNNYKLSYYLIFSCQISSHEIYLDTYIFFNQIHWSGWKAIERKEASQMVYVYHMQLSNIHISWIPDTLWNANT